MPADNESDKSKLHKKDKVPSTSGPVVELKVDLINIVFPVGKITVKCQYAKKVSFILTKPQCEPESKEKEVTDSSVKEIVEDFSGYEASTVQIQFVPLNKTTRVSIEYFEIEEYIVNGVPSPPNSVSPEESIKRHDRELNVKVYENDKEDKFHAQKITVTSRNAKETIVWGLKPDGEPKKKKGGKQCIKRIYCGGRLGGRDGFQC